MLGLFLQTGGISDYSQWGIAGAIVFMVIVFLGFLLKAMPSWKDVRLAEIAVREKEAESRAAQATSFGLLSDALKSMSEVLNNVAVAQRHATEEVRISQRISVDVAARTEDTVNQLSDSVAVVLERIDSIEKFVGKE